MIRLQPRSISFVASSFLAAAAIGCTGDGSGGDPELERDALAPGGSGASQGDCSQDPSSNSVFAPTSYGDDGTDLIRRVEVDGQTGDLWFSTWQNIYRLPSGSDEPEQVLVRPESTWPLNGAFWLRETELLMPAAPGVGQIVTAAIPGATTDIIPVLYSAPLESGAATLQVSAPAPPEDLVFYEILGARIVGDEVYWVDARVQREGVSTAAPLTRTYRARRTSWRSPAAEPTELYSSAGRLDVPIVAGNLAFIDERSSDPADRSTVQRIINLDDGSVDSVSADERFGGKVVAADDESLIIASSDFTDLDSYGVFRVAVDGSQRERLSRFTTMPELRSNDGVWALTEFDPEADGFRVHVYEVGSAPRQLGCITGVSSVHDVVAGDGEVLVAVFYTNFTANILRYTY